MDLILVSSYFTNVIVICVIEEFVIDVSIETKVLLRICCPLYEVELQYISCYMSFSLSKKVCEQCKIAVVLYFVKLSFVYNIICLFIGILAWLLL